MILTLALFISAIAPAAAHAQDKKGGPGAMAVPVIVSTAKKDKFVDKVEAIGTLRANETVTLASTVTETVTAVNFEDGQRVIKGDILVEMTDGEEKALIDQQKALVNEAAKQLERARDLSRNGAISKSVLEERQRDFISAKSGMAALQSRLEDHIIVAPFDGIVGLRNISVGALLQPGMTITTLDDDTTMKLDFSVPSVFLSVLNPGLGIVAKAVGFKESFEGAVSAVNSQIDTQTRSVQVRAVIPNPDATLKPGLLMTVQLLKDPRESVMISEEAIIPEGRKTFILVVKNSDGAQTVEKREIVIGSRRPGDVEVVSGLEAGEKYVVQGTMSAQAGKPIRIIAEQEGNENLDDVLKKVKPPAEKAQ